MLIGVTGLVINILVNAMNILILLVKVKLIGLYEIWYYRYKKTTIDWSLSEHAKVKDDWRKDDNPIKTR